jgi:hypothetical protein
MGRECGPSGGTSRLSSSADDPLLAPSLLCLSSSMDGPLLHHRSPPGGGFVVAEISYQRHNKMFVEKDTGNIASVNTQRLSEGLNHE